MDDMHIESNWNHIRRFHIGVFYVLACLFAVPTIWADDSTETESGAEPSQSDIPQEKLTPADALKRGRQFEQQAEQMRPQVEAVEKAVAKRASEVRLLQLQIANLNTELAKTQAALTTAMKGLDEHKAAHAKTVTANQETATRLDSANKALATAQQKVEQEKAAYKVSMKAEADAAAKVAEFTKTFTDVKGKVDDMMAKATQLPVQLKTLLEQQAAEHESAKEVHQKWVATRQQAESMLKQAGEWVDFSKEIAPIVHRRCLTCHNARIAKGRYSMHSFQAILKGGESGSAIDYEALEFSPLLAMIEDGSMPKDADPLTDAEIATVKKWVKLGARLNAGVDSKRPLLQIMPRPEHPEPPLNYARSLPITAMDWSPHGQTLATSGYHEVLLWSPVDGKLVSRIANVAERVYSIDFHPDGGRIAVASGIPGELGEVKIFKVDGGQLIHDFMVANDTMLCVKFSPDGTRLATAGADRLIRIFDVETSELLVVIEDHADWVNGLSWSPDGKQLASASRDKTAKLFNTETGDAVATFSGHNDVVTDVQFLSDGQLVASSGRDKQIRIWKVADGKQTRAIAGFGNEVTDLELTNSNLLTSTSADKSARVHNPADGKLVNTFANHPDWLSQGAVHPEGTLFAVGGFDGAIRIWKLDDGTEQLRWIGIPNSEPADP